MHFLKCDGKAIITDDTVFCREQMCPIRSSTWMHTNNRKRQINSFQKSTALAIGHLSILGCSLFRGVYFVWQCWKSCPYKIGVEDIKDRIQALKNGYRKTTVVGTRSKRIYTGFMKTAVNTNSHMSEQRYNRWEWSSVFFHSIQIWRNISSIFSSQLLFYHS